METSGSFNGWLACLLGAMNGFLVGSIASTAIYFYNEYQNWRLLHGDLVSDMSAHFARPVEPAILLLVLCLFIFVFSIAGFIVHRLWFSHLKSAVMLWQYVGVVAVIIGTIVIISFDVSSGSTIFRYQNFVSLEFIGFCLLMLYSLSVINLIYAKVLEKNVEAYRINRG